ncbi:MAG TPA: glycosyltransferase [Longimicrobium sp.]|nr:glycosyltransferase [Longimicrobium sp.]
MSAPLRVLHLVQNLNYGGMERLIHELARLADPARLEVHVMALQYVGRFGQGLEGVAPVHLAGRMEPWSLLRPAVLAQRIRRIGPRVVHTHSGVWLKGARAARMAGVPRVVHTEHGRRHPDPPADRWLDGRAARWTDVVCAVSRPLAAQLEARVVRGRASVAVVRNGVDTEVFHPRADDGRARAALGIAPGAPVLGSIGRLEPVKGYDVAVRALALLLAGWSDGPAPVLLVAGDGSERARLAALARALGIADHVLLPGWRDDLAALHPCFSLFTLSSHSEGTSVSLLEAMSAGLCPVVTDAGGNADVLGPALRHRLVPRNDPAALARAWRDALRDIAARRADGRAARERVTARFSAHVMALRYEAVYRGAPLSDDDAGAAWRAEPIDPTGSADSVDSTDSMDSTDSVDSVDSTDSTDSTDRVDAVEDGRVALRSSEGGGAEGWG